VQKQLNRVRYSLGLSDVGLRNHVLDGGPHLLMRKGTFEGGCAMHCIMYLHICALCIVSLQQWANVPAQHMAVDQCILCCKV